MTYAYIALAVGLPVLGEVPAVGLRRRAAIPHRGNRNPLPPTRAPDSEFRQMRDKLCLIRNTDLPNVWGWGRGVPIPSVSTRTTT